MGALAILSIFIIVQVAYSCIPALQPPSNSNSTEVPSEPPTKEPTKATTTTQKVTTSKPVNKECVTVELNPGRPCVFPFNYQYKDRYECLPFKDKYWCGLTSVYDKKEWGYCDESLCPPTAVLPTEMSTKEPPVTQGSTDTTTEALSPLEWEEGSTTAAIMDSGMSQSCDIRFELALEKGVQFREISSVCSASSQNTGDMIEKLGIHSFSLTTLTGIELACEVGAVLLADSKTLSGEVLNSSLKCEAVEAECVTVDGQVYPAQCILPFNYQGRRYLACTDRPGSTKLWCPTQVDESGEALEQYWGYCSQMCGYCGGSPLKTREGQEESCGYDCLLGADWNMVGFDKAPLSKPTIAPSQPREENYIGLVAGQHQLNIGPQSVSITCPETKFYDPALFGEDSVLVECGRDKYRFTVTTESGVILGTAFQNDQFGCDPCPKSMSYVEGYLYYKDFESMGTFYNIDNIGQCNTLCLDNTGCNSIQFSKKKSRCQLVKKLVQKPSSMSRYKDYIVCSKSETMCQLKTVRCPPKQKKPLTGLAFDNINNMIFQAIKRYADTQVPDITQWDQKAYFVVVGRKKWSEKINELQNLQEETENAKKSEEAADKALVDAKLWLYFQNSQEQKPLAVERVEEAMEAVKAATKEADGKELAELTATYKFMAEFMATLETGGIATPKAPAGTSDKTHSETQLLHKMISQTKTNNPKEKMLFLYSRNSPCAGKDRCLETIMKYANALQTGIAEISVDGILTGSQKPLREGKIRVDITVDLEVEQVSIADGTDGTKRAVTGKGNGIYYYMDGVASKDIPILELDLKGTASIPGIGSGARTIKEIKLYGSAQVENQPKLTIKLEKFRAEAKIGEKTTHKWVVGFDSWWREYDSKTQTYGKSCKQAKEKWCSMIKEKRKTMKIEESQLNFVWFNNNCPELNAATTAALFDEDC